MKLYSYFRSSAAFRVRIALNFKGLAYEQVPIHLLRDGGEQKKPAYRAVNPQGRVPALVVETPGGGETILTQSLAIIEYLNEIAPEPPLLPADPIARARVRAGAQLIACDIHPLNNTGTIGYLKEVMGQPTEAIRTWYAHFVRDGFTTLEQVVAPGPYCFGSEVTIADLCLVPQMFNAWRFKVPVDDFPRLLAITEACLKLKPFADARPEAQPDAE
jgi:maleylacetoacetate isomerase